MRFSILFILSLLFSSCLVNSRIGYHQQSETKHDIHIKGSSALLVFSAPLNEKGNVDDLIKQLMKLDLNLESRSTAIKKGVDIPAYIAPDSVETHISKLAATTNYDYLIIVDGYPVATEYNGGNLVATIIEVWDLQRKGIKYNSHSTIKSKERYVNNDEGSIGGTIFNGVVGTPVEEEELLYKGILREIRKLKRVY